MNISLNGKVAVVTGASSGIGLAITRTYLDCDSAGVVAVFRWKEVPDELSEALRLNPDRLMMVRAMWRWSRPRSRSRRQRWNVSADWNVLVSNAAISIVKAVHLHTPEEWDTVMNANVKSLYWAARHVIPVMMEQKSGLILISGSISGEVGIPTQGAYAPPKAALHQMARQMAIEYGAHGIRVNTIACGTVDTPIVHQSAAASGDPDGYWKMLRNAHPIGRIASADEVASFYAYMATDLASFFTGAILLIDGGYTAQ